jgi:hypothetical protein
MSRIGFGLAARPASTESVLKDCGERYGSYSGRVGSG